MVIGERVASFISEGFVVGICRRARCSVAEAAHDVVVYKPGGLHEGVADGGADEGEAVGAEGFAHGAGLVGLGGYVGEGLEGVALGLTV